MKSCLRSKDFSLPCESNPRRQDQQTNVLPVELPGLLCRKELITWSTHKIIHAIIAPITIEAVCVVEASVGIKTSSEVESSADGIKTSVESVIFTVVVSKTLLVIESAADDSEDVENVLFAGAASLIN